QLARRAKDHTSTFWPSFFDSKMMLRAIWSKEAAKASVPGQSALIDLEGPLATGVSVA
ncbi:unnamed protein product, partial [Tilletia controversa]